jgi:hypothetical protein
MEETMKSIRLFGMEVIPRIHEIGTAGSSSKETLASAAD